MAILFVAILVTIPVLGLILKFWWTRRKHFIGKLALFFFSLMSVSFISISLEERGKPLFLFFPALGLAFYHFIFFMVYKKFWAKKALLGPRALSPSDADAVLKGAKIIIELQGGERYEVKDLSDEEAKEIIARLAGKSRGVKDPQSGAVSIELILVGVPALIALGLVSALIYQIVTGQDVHEILTTAIPTLLGYYFGMGASQAMEKSKPITREDLARLLPEQHSKPPAGQAS